MARLQGQGDDFGVAETVAGLSERVMHVEQALQSLMDERWSAAGKNFETINANILSLHDRLEELERRARIQ